MANTAISVWLSLEKALYLRHPLRKYIILHSNTIYFMKKYLFHITADFNMPVTDPSAGINLSMRSVIAGDCRRNGSHRGEISTIP